MRRTLLALSALALLAIITNVVFTVNLLPAAHFTFNRLVLIATPVVRATAEALALASGVVALVATAQRREWAWFTGVFILLFISVYWNPLFYLALPYVGVGRALLYVPIFAFDLALQAATPLATLIYSFSLTESELHRA